MTPITYHSGDVNGLRVFYRQAGHPDAPKLLLLHGYPTASYMFRDRFDGSAFVLGTPGLPLADIPLQQMISKAEDGRYHAKPVRVLGFEEIVKAHQAMEEGLAAGKMVVAVS